MINQVEWLNFRDIETPWSPLVLGNTHFEDHQFSILE
jgi:hypothetical protein